MGIRFTLITIFFSFLFGLSSFADVSFNDAVFPELATSGRALAMGNAFTSKVDDSAAVFYNPAGLGSIRKTHFHLSNLHIEFNKGWMDMGYGGKVTDIASGFMDGFKLDGMRTLLLENKGTLAHTRFQLMPNFVTRYFSFGYMLSKKVKATIGVEDDADFEYASRLDHGPFAAMNFSIWGGILKFGASATLLNRNEAIGTSTATETIDLQSNDYKKGTAAIITSGVRLTLPMVFLPTFSAVLHNSFDQGFTGRAAGSPDQIKNTMDVGFSLTPQIGNIVRLHLEGNYKDLGQEYSNVSATRRLVLGMELDVGRRFFVRGGYGDGFGSGGIGIKTQKLEFDLTTYAVDTTSSEFRGKEDRRFSLTISSGL